MVGIFGRWGIALVLATALGSCATEPKPMTEIQGIDNDQFSQTAVVEGGLMTDQGPDLYLRWFLRSVIDKHTHAVTHELYFATEHQPPRFIFFAVADENAEPLPLLKIRPRKECQQHDCLESEDVAVPLDEARLRTHLETGFKLKISARDGSAYILDITPVMIRLQFEAVERVRQSLAAAGAPPPPSRQLGIEARMLKSDDLVAIRNPGITGMVVTNIDPGTVADRAGLDVGDVIVECNGVPIVRPEDLMSRAAAIGGHGSLTVVAIHPNDNSRSLYVLSR